MTLLQTFTDSTDNNSIALFTDFVGDCSPFGIVKTNNAIGIPTEVYSNTNDSALGTVTCTTATSVPGGGIYTRIGIYQSVSVTGAVISRAWDVRNNDYEIEARLKSNLDRGTYLLTCGYSLNHNTTNTAVSEAGAFFYCYGNETTWKATVHANYVALKTVDTGVNCKDFSTLRVVASQRGTKFEFYANDRLVMKWLGGDVADAAGLGSFSMPCIELRDRTAGGSGFTQSFVADYLMTKERINR